MCKIGLRSVIIRCNVRLLMTALSHLESARLGSEREREREREREGKRERRCCLSTERKQKNTTFLLLFLARSQIGGGEQLSLCARSLPCSLSLSLSLSPSARHGSPRGRRPDGRVLRRQRRGQGDAEAGDPLAAAAPARSERAERVPALRAVGGRHLARRGGGAAYGGRSGSGAGKK